MANTKDSAPAATREGRGIALFRERGAEIERVYPGIWTVPSCSADTAYAVHLAPRVRCNCPDYERRGEPCKHIYAATVAASKGKSRKRSA